MFTIQQRLMFPWILIALSACTPGLPVDVVDDQAVARAEDAFAKRGVMRSDITVIGVYAFKGYNGRSLINYVWARTGGCKGWFVQRIDNPTDIFTMDECRFPTTVRE
jgi:sarcosine oxidase delta subunit